MAAVIDQIGGRQQPWGDFRLPDPLRRLYARYDAAHVGSLLISGRSMVLIWPARSSHHSILVPPVARPGLLMVTAQRHGTATVLQVAGEIDLTTSAQLRDEIRQCLNSTPAVLILDLTRVAFLGAAGLTVLVEAHQVAGRETVVRVVANSRIVLRPMQMTEIDRVMAVFGSVEEAVAAL